MERAALLVVDSGLVTVGSRGHVSPPSPGLALIEEGVPVLGRDAAESARLKPRRIHSRFWQQLSTEPLGRPFPPNLRTADLAHAHLSSVWSSVGRGVDEVILVVPGLYSADQLALLLGIAAAAEVPVRGLVDVAVAAAADRTAHTRCLHLDLHLHRAVLTELRHGPEIVRGRVWENDHVGVLGLTDLWARTVARQFVRETRLDPLHLASTEQQLYLELPRHIEALAAHASIRVAVDFDGRRRAIDLELRHLEEATRSVTDGLAAWVAMYTRPEASTVLVSNHLALLPLLDGRLRETADCDVVGLHPAAACSAALGHAERIVREEAALPLVTRLPGYDAAPPNPVTVAVSPPTGAVANEDLPTHLVIDGVAQPITRTPVVIGPGDASDRAADGVDVESNQEVVIRRLGDQIVVEAPARVEVRVNGQMVESTTALAAGDRLHVGEKRREILLVTMAK
jgi:hypothetical protein